jgi:hypothetical protein
LNAFGRLLPAIEAQAKLFDLRPDRESWRLNASADFYRDGFLLTGSANLALMRQVSESLAGRASDLTLWPKTRRGQRGLGRCGRWGQLLDTPDSGWLELLMGERESREDWRSLAGRGGHPTPALELTSATDRRVCGLMVISAPISSATCWTSLRSAPYPISDP